MAETLAEEIKYNLKSLPNYINNLEDFTERYEDAINQLCIEHKITVVNKSEQMLEFENIIKEAHANAIDLYNDIKRIANKYKLHMNLDNEILLFNNKANRIKFPLFEGVTVRVVPTKDVSEGVPTGGAANIEDSYDTKLQEYLVGLYNDYKNIKNPIDTIMYAVGVFITNYFELKDANTIGADKYFHARANYEASQQGIVGELIAKVISDLRELTDEYRNVYEKGYSKVESEKDVKEDQKANSYGRILGRNHPLRPAYDILKHLMPKGFPERYKTR